MRSNLMADPSASPRRKVLWFSYEFPPHGGPGSRRCIAFVHHLAEIGWRSTVITHSPGGADEAWQEGSRMIPDDVLVIRTQSLEPAFLLSPIRRLRREGSAARFIPTLEWKVGWYPYAHRRGLHNIRHAPSQVMVACVPPITSAVVVNTLSRSMGLPYIIDVRSVGPEVGDDVAYVGWTRALKLGPVARAFDESRAVTVPSTRIASLVSDLIPDVRDRIRVIEPIGRAGDRDALEPSVAPLDELLTSMIE